MRPAAHASRAMREAERYLDSLEMFGMRFGLERMRRLMTALDSPQERFALDPRPGLERQVLDGPHDRRAAEQAQVQRTRRLPVAAPRLLGRARRGRRPAGVATSASRRRSRARPRRPRWSIARSSAGDRVTQFEALTAAAYWELARAGVEVAVVEAGLGGRYDATSVIRSRVQVLTNVSLEHTRWLGPTERHIAEEKLAVVPARRHAGRGPRSGPRRCEVAERVDGRARTRGCCCWGRDFDDSAACRCARAGAFQRENFAVAVAAARGLPRPARPGATCAPPRRRSRTPGRLEVVARRAAHDPRRRAQPGGRRARSRARSTRSSGGAARWA